MSINLVNGIIRVIGGTEATPNTFGDIITAGYGTQQGNQYRFTNPIVIGDGSTESWLIDSNKQVEITAVQTIYEVYPSGGGAALHVRTGGNLRLGEITNESSKATEKGCLIYSRYVSAQGFEHISSTSGGNLELYSSTLISDSFGYLWHESTVSGKKFRVWNCSIGVDVIDANFIGATNRGIADFSNTTVNGNGLTNSIGVRVLGEVSKVSVFNTDLGAIGMGGGQGITSRGLFARNNNNIIRVSGSSLNAYLIDTDTDTWAVRWDNTSSGRVFRQWSMNLNSTNSTNNLVIALYDKDGNEVFNDFTDGSGVLSEKIVSQGYYSQDNGSTLQTYNPHTIRIRKYGKVFQDLSKEIASKIVEGITDVTNTFVSASEVNAGNYTGITINGSAKTITVSGTRTLQELYDYSQYWASQSANMEYDEPIITNDGTTFTLASGWSITVSGSLAEESKILADKASDLTVSTGGFFEDLQGAIWNTGGTLYHASHAYIKVIDADTNSAIEGAVIGFGDEVEEERLLYNTSLAIDSLVTDASGEANGYFVYKIGATSYTSMKQVVGEYSYTMFTVPRSISGSPVGSPTNRDTVRMAPDTEVTLSKTNAGAITGITVDVINDTIDLSDETLSNAYDNLKYQITDNTNIDTGIPGCMYFCLYGSPIEKSGNNYTGRSASTIYQNFNGTGATFGTGIVELDSAGTYNNLTFSIVQFNFEAIGTYDLRGSTFQNTVTVDTIGDYTVTAQLPVGTSVTNNDVTNITVETSTAITISNVNLVDGSRVQLYNITQATEIENTTVSGGSGYSYNATLGAGEEIEDGDTIRLRATKEDKLEYEATATATASGISFLGSQETDTIYNTYGLTGSDFDSKFTADYVDTEVDIVVAEDFNGASLYAWWKYNLTTSQGISDFFGGLTAIDAANLRINNDLVSIYLDNTTSTEVYQTDTIRVYRSDGARPVKRPTTGGAGIDLNWKSNVYLAQTVGEPVITGDISEIATANQTATAVRSELSTELSRIDVDISSRLSSTDYSSGTSPSASEIATEVRSELGTELARIDTTISSRLATSSYTVPDNASITAILADTNELQTNQGNWTTATGFSTHSVSDVVTAMQSVADDFKADVSDLSTIQGSLGTINEGVKKSSIFIPHTEDI